jgi:drug/metabolite transporter (DMT)-like permease
MLVVALAFAAACLFATGVVLQQRSAAQVDAAGGGTRHLIANVIRSRRWWVGKACDVSAFAVQAVALSRGSLLAVQAVLSSGVVIALGLSAVWDRRRLRVNEWIGVVSVAAGLVAFLAIGRPVEGDPSGATTIWFVAAAIATISVVVSLIGSNRWVARHAAVILGAVSGGLYALNGAIVKQVAEEISHHVLVALAWFVGFVVVGIVSNVTATRGFQLAPLSVSLPMLTAVEPLCAFALGAFLFEERLSDGVVPVIGAVVGAGLLISGALRCARAMPHVPGGSPPVVRPLA